MASFLWARRQSAQMIMLLLQVPWDSNVKLFSTIPGYRVPVHVRQVANMSEAELIVVQDPANPAAHPKFTAGIMGASLCTPEYADSKASRGSCVAFRRATSIHRKVFITDAFMGENLAIAQDLMQAFRIDNCKWQLQANAPAGSSLRQTLILRGSAEMGRAESRITCAAK